MNEIKILGLVLMLAVCTGFIFASSGSTSVSLERGVSVQVVSDERAYVGYQSSDLTVRDGKTVDLVTLENRFTEAINILDITVEDGTFTISNLTNPADIHSGENGTIRGEVECTPNETQEVELTVALNGSGVTAQISGDTETREFTLTCAPEIEGTPQVQDSTVQGTS